MDLPFLYGSCLDPLSCVYIGEGYAIAPATMTWESNTLILALATLGDATVSVVPPKLEKASTIVTVACRCRQHYRLKYIANVHEPLV